MGGAPCKVILDGGADNGMGERLIGAVRQMQTINDNISKTIVELDEYLTPSERKAVLDVSYRICEFGDDVILKCAEEIEKFTSEVSDFFIDLAKKHAYAVHAYEDPRAAKTAASPPT